MNAEISNQMTEPIFRAFSFKIKPTPPLKANINTYFSLKGKMLA